MGIYTDYMSSAIFNPETLAEERKKCLRTISDIRGRDVIVYAADWYNNKGKEIPVAILPQDLLAFQDQLSYLKSEDIDLILETPGGIAETAEDIVNLIRTKHKQLGVIIPGTAKSAGTILSMAADEILMSNTSSLGPIDAQIMINGGKRISADAFIDGFEKIKEEVVRTGKLNPAYIPMLQNMSPGELQACENAQNFSRELVKKWLSNYKFKDWNIHKSTGKDVTHHDRVERADKIAKKLCKHSDWLTHSRSIRINELRAMQLEITDYTEVPDLNDAIDRYYTLLRLTFDNTPIFKIFETAYSQIHQAVVSPIVQQQMPIEHQMPTSNNQFVLAQFICPKCNKPTQLQLNFVKGLPLSTGAIAYPKDDIFSCNCGIRTNISQLRLMVETKTKRKVEL